VPKTRPAVSRDEKVGEILEAAARRLREGGYEALSVAGIARELGLAQNAIYWYFPSKDALFVAALERMLREIVARKPSRQVGEIERILWFTDQSQALSDLRGAMNERARSSPVVADFVQELDALLSRMLSNALRDHVPEADLPVAVETFRATVEGTFVKGLGKRERRKVLTFALERLMGSEGGA
jgi:AcrR family transcriptional regulator